MCTVRDGWHNSQCDGSLSRKGNFWNNDHIKNVHMHFHNSTLSIPLIWNLCKMRRGSQGGCSFESDLLISRQFLLWDKLWQSGPCPQESCSTEEKPHLKHIVRIGYRKHFIRKIDMMPWKWRGENGFHEVEQDKEREREIYRGNNGQSLWTWNVSVERLGKGGSVAQSTPDVEVRWGEAGPLGMAASSWMAECGEHVWKEWELSLDRSQVTNNNILRAKDNI